MSKSDRYSGENGLSFRYANSDDNLLVLNWRNTPEVRKYSRSSEIINKEIHDHWFSKRLAKIKLEPIFVFSFQGKDLGMVRLDEVRNSSSTFEISIAVDKEYQNRGFASSMVYQILLLARNEFAATELVAHVHQKNLPSIRLFTRLNFDKTSNTQGEYEEYRIYL